MQATHTSHMAFPPVVSVSPRERAGSVRFQMVSKGEEGARHCTAVSGEGYTQLKP